MYKLWPILSRAMARTFFLRALNSRVSKPPRWFFNTCDLLLCVQRVGTTVVISSTMGHVFVYFRHKTQWWCSFCIHLVFVCWLFFYYYRSPLFDLHRVSSASFSLSFFPSYYSVVVFFCLNFVEFSKNSLFWAKLGIIAPSFQNNNKFVTILDDRTNFIVYCANFDWTFILFFVHRLNKNKHRTFLIKLTDFKWTFFQHCHDNGSRFCAANFLFSLTHLMEIVPFLSSSIQPKFLLTKRDSILIQSTNSDEKKTCLIKHRIGYNISSWTVKVLLFENAVKVYARSYALTWNRCLFIFYGFFLTSALAN